MRDKDLNSLGLKYQTRLNEKDFGLIYFTLYKPLNNFLAKLIKSKAEREDIITEAMLRMQTYIHMYKPEYSFKTWVFTIAKNIALYKIKRAKAYPMFSLDNVINDGDENKVTFADMLEDGTVYEESRPEKDYLEIDFKYGLVLEQILSYHEPERFILIKKYIEGDSYKECSIKLSEKLGWTEKKALAKVNSTIRAFCDRMRRKEKKGFFKQEMD